MKYHFWCRHSVKVFSMHPEYPPHQLAMWKQHVLLQERKTFIIQNFGIKCMTWLISGYGERSGRVKWRQWSSGREPGYNKKDWIAICYCCFTLLHFTCICAHLWAHIYVHWVVHKCVLWKVFNISCMMIMSTFVCFSLLVLVFISGN